VINSQPLFGAIEGGGTKFLCAVGSPGNILDQCEFPTTTPDETLGRAGAFFRNNSAGRLPEAIGVASFGPIDPNPTSPSYGTITTTPKLHWQHTDVVGRLTSEFGVPIGWDTDVNGAALGEWQWGAGRGADPVLYVTVGTGIGGGAVVNGRTLHGLVHPEMGHLPVPVIPEDSFAGVCPFHDRCLEGVASGPAIEARLGRRGDLVSPDDPVWETEAIYLALGLLSMVYILSSTNRPGGRGHVDAGPNRSRSSAPGLPEPRLPLQPQHGSRHRGLRRPPRPGPTSRPYRSSGASPPSLLQSPMTPLSERRRAEQGIRSLDQTPARTASKLTTCNSCLFSYIVAPHSAPK
jgi:fructokinase